MRVCRTKRCICSKLWLSRYIILAVFFHCEDAGWSDGHGYTITEKILLYLGEYQVVYTWTHGTFPHCVLQFLYWFLSEGSWTATHSTVIQPSVSNWNDKSILAHAYHMTLPETYAMTSDHISGQDIILDTGNNSHEPMRSLCTQSSILDQPFWNPDHGQLWTMKSKWVSFSHCVRRSSCRGYSCCARLGSTQLFPPTKLNLCMSPNMIFLVLRRETCSAPRHRATWSSHICLLPGDKLNMLCDCLTSQNNANGSKPPCGEFHDQSWLVDLPWRFDIN